MKIFKLLSTSLAVLCFSSDLLSDITFYGKINTSYESTDKNSKTDTDFKNNASRLGVKGKFDINDGLKISFQIENEIDPTDGRFRADGEKVFKERNTFLALEGNFGRLFAGTHDTAFKVAQLKVDLFNDTRADIKYLFQGENRMNSFVAYTTPELIDGLKVTINSISQSTGTFESYSVNYSTGSIKLAFALDSNGKGYDSTRFTTMFPIESLGIDVGLMYQSSEKISTGVSENGHLLSLKKKVSDKGSVYLQTASSDIKLESGKQNSIGYDYKISKIAKVFFHYSDLESDKTSKNSEYVSVGFEYKFWYVKGVYSPFLHQSDLLFSTFVHNKFMDQAPKQERSRKRIEVILTTAENILLENGIDSVTIANISKVSGLKRTSTYKFFQTPEAIKAALATKYFIELSKDFSKRSSDINTAELSVIVLRTVEIIYDYFSSSIAAQQLVLSNTTSLPVTKEPFHELSSSVQEFIERNIELPEFFNNDGVFRVFTQIIISIFSLNTRESGILNEVGKIEANRAAHAYILNWVNQSK